MFAFGVTLFRLLSGERPFPSNNSQILKRHTVELRYNVSSGDWENVSGAAKDMIRKLLINKQERLTASEALNHRWFQEVGASVLPVDRTHTGVGGVPPDDSRSRATVRVSRSIRLHFALSYHSFSIWKHLTHAIALNILFFFGCSLTHPEPHPLPPTPIVTGSIRSCKLLSLL